VNEIKSALDFVSGALHNAQRQAARREPMEIYSKREKAMMANSIIF